MPEVVIEIGGRSFEVACQPGEEHYLMSAARLLHAEAETLSDQVGRLTESRMLLMAGLMLADKTAGLEEELRATQRRLSEAEGRVLAAESRPPERMEVPVIPESALESLAELAARTEALAAEVEEIIARSEAAESDPSATGQA